MPGRYVPPPKPPRRLRRRLISALTLAATVAVSVLLVTHFQHDTPAPADQAAAGQQATAATNTPPLPASFNRHLYSTDIPSSPWVVVNKKRPLNPIGYIPPLVTPQVPLREAANNPEMQLRPETAAAVEKLFAAAKQDGLSLMVASGYRSYNLQVSVYGNEVKTYGQAKADSESARPGHSEHQTGWALDVEPASRQCEVADCFGATPEGRWLAANAYKYGFIIRYTADKVAVTGYRAEPWHIRYVGTELSNEMHRTGVTTLEEFFGLPGGESY